MRCDALWRGLFAAAGSLCGGYGLNIGGTFFAAIDPLKIACDRASLAPWRRPRIALNPACTARSSRSDDL